MRPSRAQSTGNTKVVFCHGAGLPPLDPRCGAGQKCANGVAPARGAVDAARRCACLRVARRPLPIRGRQLEQPQPHDGCSEAAISHSGLPSTDFPGAGVAASFHGTTSSSLLQKGVTISPLDLAAHHGLPRSADLPLFQALLGARRSEHARSKAARASLIMSKEMPRRTFLLSSGLLAATQRVTSSNVAIRGSARLQGRDHCRALDPARCVGLALIASPVELERVLVAFAVRCVS